ncbi:hypothetical protein [Prevotella sp. P3-122]|uniref:hypothetical protein n=1 Tax=Prevotella sp. P3-122 TaxID=2024223 RepID=UPI00114005A0|nr:hypothetical protein [Prevotella sp. P3-122]
MKRIKKLTLHPEQVLDFSEAGRICGGKHLVNHTWNCNCTKKGDSCIETWTYLLSPNSEMYKQTGLPEPVTTGAVIYDPNTACWERSFQQWIADDSNKHHHAGYSWTY